MLYFSKAQQHSPYICIMHRQHSLRYKNNQIKNSISSPLKCVHTDMITNLNFIKNINTNVNNIQEVLKLFDKGIKEEKYTVKSLNLRASTALEKASSEIKRAKTKRK